MTHSIFENIFFPEGELVKNGKLTLLKLIAQKFIWPTDSIECVFCDLFGICFSPLQLGLFIPVATNFKTLVFACLHIL